MIRINKYVWAVPEILITKGVELTNDLQKQYDSGVINFAFRNNVFNDKSVKNTLAHLQHGKCCFCESEFKHVAYGDVEHYRPKGGWMQNDEPLNIPGYYWLVYDWNNLFLSCQICNESYKKNYFPLETEDKRATNHHIDISGESPLFIHPVNENPEDYIYYNQEIPVEVNGSLKGMVTIEKTGLKRKELIEKRKKVLNYIKMIYKLAIGNPESDEKEEARALLLSFRDDDATEYASMLRCFFKNNPIDF